MTEPTESEQALTNAAVQLRRAVSEFLRAVREHPETEVKFLDRVGESLALAVRVDVAPRAQIVVVGRDACGFFAKDFPLSANADGLN